MKKGLLLFGFALILTACGDYAESRYHSVAIAYHSNDKISAEALNGFWVLDSVEEVGPAKKRYDYDYALVRISPSRRFLLEVNYPAASISYLSKAMTFPNVDPEFVNPLDGFSYFASKIQEDKVDRQAHLGLSLNTLTRTDFIPNRPMFFLPLESRIVKLDSWSLELAIRENDVKGQEVFQIIVFRKVTPENLITNLPETKNIFINPNVEGLHQDFYRAFAKSLLKGKP